MSSLLFCSMCQRSLQACWYDSWLVIGAWRSRGNFLSNTLFNAIAYGIGIRDADVDDISDATVLESLSKVVCSSTILCT